MRSLIILAAVGTLSACSGQSSPNGGSTTTVPSPKDAVRAQMTGMVASYLENMVRQIPSVTSKVALADVAKCVNDRLGQFIDAAEQQENQPDADFASMLMSQAQSSLYGIVGSCAQLGG